MRFDYTHFIIDPYGDGTEDKSYYRPILDVQLKHNDNKISTEALLDSGADYCVFEMGFGHSIGIDVESVKPEITRGINNKDTKIYFHNACNQLIFFHSLYSPHFTYNSANYLITLI